MRHILIILTFFITCTANAQNKDSVTLKGKIVDFENKESMGSIVAIFNNFEVESNKRLADVEIDKLSFIVYVNTDEYGNFEMKLTQGDYIMRIISFGVPSITKHISLKDSIVDLGIFDIFSPILGFDEPSADAELRRRVYNRIMKYRCEGNPTKYNIIKDEEINTEFKSNKIDYRDYKLCVKSFNEEHKTIDTAQVKGVVVDAYDEIDITTSKVIFSNYSDNFADSIANKVRIETSVNVDGEYNCTLPYGYYVCTITDPTGKYDINEFTVEIDKKQLDMGFKYIDPEAKTKYLSNATIVITPATIGWKEDKRKLQRYNAKMEKKYSRLEESSYNELLQKENL